MPSVRDLSLLSLLTVGAAAAHRHQPRHVHGTGHSSKATSTSSWGSYSNSSSASNTLSSTSYTTLTETGYVTETVTVPYSSPTGSSGGSGSGSGSGSGGSGSSGSGSGGSGSGSGSGSGGSGSGGSGGSGGVSVAGAGTCPAPTATTTVTETNVVTVTVGGSGSGAGSPSMSGNSVIPSKSAWSASSAAAPSTATVVPVASSSAAAPAAPPSSAVSSAASQATAAQASSSASPASGSANTGSNSGSSGSSGSTGKGSSAPGNGKRGLAYDNTSPGVTNAFTGQGNSISWAYDWQQAPPMGSNGQVAIDTSRFTYLPTLKSAIASSWDSDVSNCMSNYGSTVLFSLNEPDNAGQENMSPSQAASYQNQYMSPYYGKATISAPSVSNGVGCSGSQCYGVDYLLAMFDACDSNGYNCDVDMINLHWYAEDSSDASGFIEYIKNATQTINSRLNKSVSVAITEFNPTGVTGGSASDWLTSAMNWLDNESSVTHYSYFMAEVTAPCPNCAPYLAEGSADNPSIASPMGTTYTS